MSEHVCRYHWQGRPWGRSNTRDLRVLDSAEWVIVRIPESRVLIARPTGSGFETDNPPNPLILNDYGTFEVIETMVMLIVDEMNRLAGEYEEGQE